MSISVIIILVLLAVILFLIEFLILPGVTVAGIGGIISMAVACFLSYNYYGETFGTIILISSLVFVIVVIIFSLRAKTWKHVILNKTIEYKINEDKIKKVKIGDKGKTISKLSNIGKISLDSGIYEAKSIDGFIDANTKIEVFKILNNEIIVKKIL